MFEQILKETEKVKVIEDAYNKAVEVAKMEAAHAPILDAANEFDRSDVKYMSWWYRDSASPTVFEPTWVIAKTDNAFKMYELEGNGEPIVGRSATELVQGVVDDFRNSFEEDNDDPYWHEIEMSKPEFSNEMPDDLKDFIDVGIMKERNV